MRDEPETPRSSETETAPSGALERRLGRLPRELAPARDLWPEIEARLDGRRTRWRMGLGLAAGIAAVAILGVIGLQLSQRARRDVTTQANASTNTDGRNTDGLTGTDGRTSTDGRTNPDRYSATRAAREAAYLRTQSAVEQSYEQELAHLPKATQVRLRQDLAIIRNARADIRRALDAAPENPLLQQLFADTWQQEMDFYSSIASTNNPAGVRWPM
jgi:hypothetical protein